MHTTVRFRLRPGLAVAALVACALVSTSRAADGAKPARLPINITADRYDVDVKTGRAVGKGHVRVAYQDIVLHADTAEVHLATYSISARGNVFLKRGTFEWHGPELAGNLERKVFWVPADKPGNAVRYVMGSGSDLPSAPPTEGTKSK